MESASKLALALIGILLVAACQDTPTSIDPADLGPTRIEEPLFAQGGEGEQSGESIDPSTYRIVFTFTAESGLLPKQAVSLLIEGVAVEPVTGGEVIVTLPTVAAMDHAGPDDAPYFPAGRKLPVIDRWVLPPMAAGDRWKQRVTIPAMEKGYYQVALSAGVEGPRSDLGPFMIDDVYHQVWMFVSDRDAVLTRTFDESVFPEGTRPVPGPILTPGVGRDASDMAYSAMPDTARRRYVYTLLAYPTGGDYQPAARAQITGAYVHKRNGTSHGRKTQTVPDNGIVRWTCPGNNVNLEGFATAQATQYVKEAEHKLVVFWDAERSECGDTILVSARRWVYMPWNHLNESAKLIEGHIEYERNRRVRWRVRLSAESSSYNKSWDRITFNAAGYGSRWTAAHEYGHAIHHKKLGGMWSTQNCGDHSVYRVSSYTCAFSEGLADYLGNVGAPDDQRYGSWEDFTTDDPGTRGKIEGWVAALFHDLIDGGSEEEDETEYEPHYVMTVFKSCRVKPLVGGWTMRNDVSDFVWCLENRVNVTVHNDKFPGIIVPVFVDETADEPDDWDADDIRSTWLLNVG